jgi:hypothetical protein
MEGADRSLRARLYPSRGENGGSCSVVINLKEAAEWFFRYCGEYADGKQLHSDVLLWSPEVQKHVLLCWLNGDGSQSHTGVWGGTASFHLMSQMHVIAARCGWYSRKQIVFGNKTVDVSQVVNGQNETVVRDHRGWLPQFRLNVSDPVGFGSEIRWLEPEKARVTLSSFTDGFKRVGNWMLYRVRETSVECYSGPVHNFEVEVDNSYVVEGVAVHNCDHVRFEKGNTFYDDNGQKFRVAELCGDESLEPNGGVTFIEASWVEIPAFTGAVARNIVSVDTKSDPEKKTAQKIQRVFESPATKVDPNAMRKAASERMADMFDEDPSTTEDIPPAAETPTAPSSEVSPLHGIQDEIKKFILENVQEQLRTELQKTKIEDQTLPPSDTPNNTVVKQAAAFRLAGMKRAYSASLREIIATSKTSADLLNRVATLNQEIGISVPVSIYRAMLKVGARNSYPDVNLFLRAASKALGHQPTPIQARTMIRLASLLEAHWYFRRHADTNRS